MNSTSDNTASDASSNADTARYLVSRGLRLVPMYPVDEAGNCTCALADCNGKTDLHAAGKHPRWRAGASTAMEHANPWETSPDDGIGIDRETSHIVTVEDDGDLQHWAADLSIVLHDTLTLISPAGNKRLVYRLPDGFTAARNWVKPDGYAVDILCRGRAPGPGTRSNGGVYGFAHDRGVADAPGPLLSWLLRKYADRQASAGEVVAAEEFDGELPETVQAALDTDGTDRSAKTYAVVMACFDAGLSQGETAGVVEDHCVEATEKFGARRGGIEAEVASIWGKLDDSEPEWLTERRTPTMTELFHDQDDKRVMALARRYGVPLEGFPQVNPNGQDSTTMAGSGQEAAPPSYSQHPPGAEGPPVPQPDRLGELERALVTAEGLHSIPAPQPLVAGLLFFDSLAWISGKPGCCKTFVALDLAFCVGTGVPFHGSRVQRGRVLYVIAEGASGLAQRADAWLRLNNRMAAAADVLFLPVAVQLGSPADTVALAELLAKMQPALVVIDTQARVTAGMDENSSKDMGALVATLDRLRAACRACIMLVHHTPRGAENLRGSTALEGAADTVIAVVRDGTLVTLFNDAAHGGKQKNAAEAGPLALALTDTGSGWALSSEPGAAAGSIAASSAAVLGLLRKDSEELSTAAITDLSGLSRATVRRALLDLRERLLVTSRKHGPGDVWQVRVISGASGEVLDSVTVTPEKTGILPVHEAVNSLKIQDDPVHDDQACSPAETASDLGPVQAVHACSDTPSDLFTVHTPIRGEQGLTSSVSASDSSVENPPGDAPADSDPGYCVRKLPCPHCGGTDHHTAAGWKRRLAHLNDDDKEK